MNPIRRILSSLRAQGAKTTLFKLRSVAADYCFDLRHGVDTCSWSELSGLTINSKNKEHGSAYQPTRILPLRRLFQEIQGLIDPEGVLLDIGSGKGRILLVASEFGFKKVRGVEFAHELCEISKRNLYEFKEKAGTKTEFEVIESDAAQYGIQPDETIFVLYNPFDDVILGKVLDNISSSVRAKPRKILLIYYNPRWKSVIESRSDFEKVRELDISSFKFSLYSYRQIIA